jgi:chromosome partitioning protein
VKHSEDNSNFQGSPLARELQESGSKLSQLRAQTVKKPKETRIFTVANQKGGVGKTTTTVNISAALASKGLKVLVIDLDPQGNASTALNVEHTYDTVSIYEVLTKKIPLQHVVAQTKTSENLFVAPATIRLASADMDLAPATGREYKLQKALRAYLETNEFDYVFIDCPPSLGLLTVNAFAAATEVLIPVQCEYYALEGLSQLMGILELIQEDVNPNLKISTFLMTMFDARTRLASQVVDDVRATFPKVTLNTIIPRSVRVSEAPGFGQTILEYDPSSPGALAYLEAAIEIANKR